MLNNVEKLALAAVIDSETKKACKSDLEGTADVDFVVHIHGVVAKGEDHMRQGPLASSDIHVLLAALYDVDGLKGVSERRFVEALESRYMDSDGAAVLVRSDKKLSKVKDLMYEAARKRKIPVLGAIDGRGLVAEAVARAPGVRRSVISAARRILDRMEETG